MGKMRKSKKYEQYYGQPYEPKTFQFVWVCPFCGWEKPENLRSYHCGKCGATLIRVTKKVEKGCSHP